MEVYLDASMPIEGVCSVAVGAVQRVVASLKYMPEDGVCSHSQTTLKKRRISKVTYLACLVSDLRPH
jgi:hypothetical protein